MSSIQLRDLGNRTVIPADVSFVPEKWSADNKGGFKSATIKAYGPKDRLLNLTSILKYEVDIFNDFGKNVWNGYVNEILITLGKVTIGYSLKGMANRIKVFYNDPSIQSGQRSFYTDWIEDSDGRSVFGTFERVISQSDTTSANADQKAQQFLQNLKKPVETLSFDGDGLNSFVRIECLGWLHRLEDRFFIENRGFESYTTSKISAPIGLGFTSSEVGFNADDNSISTPTGNQLLNFQKGQKIHVSGSASNDGTYTLAGVESDEYSEYTINVTMSSDDIFDATNTMNEKFQVGDIIKISDSTSNDGYYKIINVIPSKIEVDDTLTTEAANDVTFEVGSTASTEENLVDELPSNSVTIRSQNRAIYKEFDITASGTWRFKKLLLKMRKIGTPTDDALVVLFLKTGTNTYSSIESKQIDASNFSNSFGWVEFEFTGNNTVTLGSTYALVVTTESYGFDPDNFYEVQLDNEANVSGNVFFNDPDNNYILQENTEMPFQLMGVEETTEIMADVVQLGEEFETFVDVESDVDDYLYMKNYEDAYSKLMSLVDFGTSANENIVITSDTKKNIFIKKQQAAFNEDKVYKITSTGQIKDSTGRLIDDGELVYDRYIELDDTFVQYGYFTNLRKSYINGSEWNDITKTYRISSGWITSLDRFELIKNG